MLQSICNFTILEGRLKRLKVDGVVLLYILFAYISDWNLTNFSVYQLLFHRYDVYFQQDVHQNLLIFSP